MKKQLLTINNVAAHLQIPFPLSIIRWSFFVCLMVILLSSFSVYEKPDPFLGVWRSYQNGKLYMEVTIKQLGSNNINYSVRMTIDGQEKLFKNFTRNNDTLMHRLQENEAYKVYLHNDSLVFLTKDNLLKREIEWKIVPYVYRKNQLDFFRFDTVSFPNGQPHTSDSYKYFPFPLNNEFIKVNKIDSLKFITVDSVFKGKTKDCSNGHLICYFNKEGYLDSILSNNKGLFTKAFKTYYFRNKDNPQKLDSVIIHSVKLKKNGKPLMYDTDNWPLDEYGQKVQYYEKLWTLNDKGYPTGFILQDPNRMKFKFEYDGNKLIKASAIDGTEVYSIEFLYNKQDVPIKLIQRVMKNNILDEAKFDFFLNSHPLIEGTY